MKAAWEVPTADTASLDGTIATRVKEQRMALGLTIETLALRSGVSRAMISRIERHEASPTAVLLAKLTNAMGITLSQLFQTLDDDSHWVQAGSRPVWRDPATGYCRRNVAPVSAPVDLVDVTLPAGAEVKHDNAVPLNLTQIVWVLSGRLTMMIDGRDHDLGIGDCIEMRLDRPIAFRNTGKSETRYAVILSKR
jgi:DNA-binding XRE family transcriptional regulator